MEMHLRNKNNQTYKTPLRTTFVEYVRDVSGDASPKIGGIFRNSCGAVETYKARKEVPFNTLYTLI